MRRVALIEPMLALHKLLSALPPPRPRGFYSGPELAAVIGRIPSHADAQLLRHLGWVRVMRTVNGKPARCWVPPTHRWAVLRSTPN